MRILVTGSTTWTDRDAIRAALQRFPAGTVLVTGDTQGADALAIEIAEELGYTVIAMRKSDADYAKYPEAAWMGLNERMIAMGIDCVIAFNKDLGQPGRARGTQHAIDVALARGIAVETVTN